MRRLVMIGDALSQLGNVAWPFWSVRDTSANESISGRCYRERRAFRHVINALFFWQKDHCKSAYLSDVSRARELIISHDLNSRRE